MFDWFSSFGLLSQAGLISLVAIAIPIIIHIINPSKGQLVWVSNIKLYQSQKRSRANQLKIKQWLLLAVRVMLLILLSLILAQTYFEITPKQKKLVLLTPQWLALATDVELSELFTENKNSQKVVVDSSLTQINSYPQLITKRNESENFKAAPQLVSEIVESLEKLEATPEETWLYMTNYVSGANSPSVLDTFVKNKVIKEYRVNTRKKIKVAIFSDRKRRQDALLIQKVFEILPDSYQSIFEITLITDAKTQREKSNTDNSMFDVVFELSEESIDFSKKLKADGLLISDVGNLTSSITHASVSFNHQIYQFSIPSLRNIEAEGGLSNAVWMSLENKQVLTLDLEPEFAHLKFNSRFNPRFNDLVKSEQFPFILVRLIEKYLPQKGWNINFDKQGNFVSESNMWNKSIKNQSTIEHWLLLLLCLLWLIERVLSENKRREESLSRGFHAG